MPFDPQTDPIEEAAKVRTEAELRRMPLERWIDETAAATQPPGKPSTNGHAKPRGLIRIPLERFLPAGVDAPEETSKRRNVKTEDVSTFRRFDVSQPTDPNAGRVALSGPNTTTPARPSLGLPIADFRWPIEAGGNGVSQPTLRPDLQSVTPAMRAEAERFRKPVAPELAPIDESGAAEILKRRQADVDKRSAARMERSQTTGEGIIDRPIPTRPDPSELPPDYFPYFSRLVNPGVQEVRRLWNTPARIGLENEAEKIVEAEVQFRLKRGLYQPDEAKRTTFEEWISRRSPESQARMQRDGTVARGAGSSWIDAEALRENVNRELMNGLPMLAPDAAGRQDAFYKELIAIQPHDLPAARGFFEKVAEFGGQMAPFLAEFAVARKAVAPLARGTAAAMAAPASMEAAMRSGLAAGLTATAQGANEEEALKQAMLFAALPAGRVAPGTKGAIGRAAATGAVFAADTAAHGGSTQDILIAGAVAPLLFAIPDLIGFRFKGGPVDGRSEGFKGVPPDSITGKLLKRFQTLQDEARTIGDDELVGLASELRGTGSRIQKLYERMQAEPGKFSPAERAAIEDFVSQYKPAAVAARRGKKSTDFTEGAEKGGAVPGAVSATAAEAKTGRRYQAIGDRVQDAETGRIQTTKSPLSAQHLAERLNAENNHGETDAGIDVRSRDQGRVAAVEAVRPGGGAVEPGAAAVRQAGEVYAVEEGQEARQADEGQAQAAAGEAGRVLTGGGNTEERSEKTEKGGAIPAAVQSSDFSLPSSPRYVAEGGTVRDARTGETVITVASSRVAQLIADEYNGADASSTPTAAPAGPLSPTGAAVPEEKSKSQNDEKSKELAVGPDVSTFGRLDVSADAPPGADLRRIMVKGGGGMPSYDVTRLPNGANLIRFAAPIPKPVVERIQAAGGKIVPKMKGWIIGTGYTPQQVVDVIGGRWKKSTDFTDDAEGKRAVGTTPGIGAGQRPASAPLSPATSGGVPSAQPSASSVKSVDQPSAEAKARITVADAAELLAIKDHRVLIAKALEKRGYAVSAGTGGKVLYVQPPGEDWRYVVKTRNVRRQRRGPGGKGWVWIPQTGPDLTVKAFANQIRGKLKGLEGEGPGAEMAKEMRLTDREIVSLSKQLQTGLAKSGKKLTERGKDQVRERLAKVKARAEELRKPATERRSDEATKGGKESTPTKKAGEPLLANKMRATADTMESQIQDKLDPSIGRQNVTARRSRIAGGMMEEGERLQKVQRLIRAMADSADAGTMPTELKGITSRAMIEELLNYGRISTTDSMGRPAENVRIPIEKVRAGDVRDLLAAVKGKRLQAGDREVLQRLASMTESVPVNVSQIESIQRAQKLAPTARVNADLAKTKRWQKLFDEDAGETYESPESRFMRMYRAAQKLLESRPREAGEVEGDKKREQRQAERSLVGRKIPGFFPTPVAVVERMIGMAEIKPGDRVLEPSAGKGDIVQAVLDAGGEPVIVELNGELVKVLKQKFPGREVVHKDFLEIEPTEKVDVVLMNPPFEKGQDMLHVRHAYRFLKEGGRLVAVMSEGAWFRTDNATKSFREWFDSEGGGEVEKLGSGAFSGAESFRQTGVATRLVKIVKPEEGIKASTEGTEPKSKKPSAIIPKRIQPEAKKAGEPSALQKAAESAVRDATEEKGETSKRPNVETPTAGPERGAAGAEASGPTPAPEPRRDEPKTVEAAGDVAEETSKSRKVETSAPQSAALTARQAEFRAAVEAAIAEFRKSPTPQTVLGIREAFRTGEIPSDKLGEPASVSPGYVFDPHWYGVLREADRVWLDSLTAIPVEGPPQTVFYAYPGKVKEMKALAAKAAAIKIPKTLVPKKPGKPKSPSFGGPRPSLRQAMEKAIGKLPDHIRFGGRPTPEESIASIVVGKSDEPGRYSADRILLEPDKAVVTDGRRLWIAQGDFKKYAPVGGAAYVLPAKGGGVTLLDKSLTAKKTPTGGTQWIGKDDTIFPAYQDVMPRRVGAPQQVEVVEAWYWADQAARFVKIIVKEVDEWDATKGAIVVRNPNGTLGFSVGHPGVGTAEFNLHPGGVVLGGMNPQFLAEAMMFHHEAGDATVEMHWRYANVPLMTVGRKRTTVTMGVSIDASLSSAVNHALNPGLYLNDVEDRLVFGAGGVRLFSVKEAKGHGLRPALQHGETGEVWAITTERTDKGWNAFRDVPKKYELDAVDMEPRFDAAITPGWLDEQGNFYSPADAYLRLLAKLPMNKLLEAAELHRDFNAEEDTEARIHEVTNELGTMLKAVDGYLAHADTPEAETFRTAALGVIKEFNLTLSNDAQKPLAPWQTLRNPPLLQALRAVELRVALRERAKLRHEATKAEGTKAQRKAGSTEPRALQEWTAEELAYLRQLEKEGRPGFGMGAMANLPELRGMWKRGVDHVLARIKNVPKGSVRQRLVKYWLRGWFDEFAFLPESTKAAYRKVGGGKNLGKADAAVVRAALREAERAALPPGEQATLAQRRRASKQTQRLIQRAADGSIPMEQLTPDARKVLELYKRFKYQTTDEYLARPDLWPQMRAFGDAGVVQRIQERRSKAGVHVTRAYELYAPKVVGELKADLQRQREMGLTVEEPMGAKEFEEYLSSVGLDYKEPESRVKRPMGPRVRGGQFMVRRSVGSPVDDMNYVVLDLTKSRKYPVTHVFTDQLEAKAKYDELITEHKKKYGDTVIRHVRLLDPFEVEDVDPYVVVDASRKHPTALRFWDRQMAEARYESLVEKHGAGKAHLLKPEQARDIDVFFAVIEPKGTTSTLRYFKSKQEADSAIRNSPFAISSILLDPDLVGDWSTPTFRPVRDMDYLLTRSLVDERNNLETMKFTQFLVDTGAVRDLPIEGDVHIPNSPVFGAVANKWTQEPIAYLMMRTESYRTALWARLYRAYFNQWKVFKVLYNPATWMRQVFGNMGLFQWLDGMNYIKDAPWTFQAIAESLKRGPVWRQLVGDGRIQYWSEGELVSFENALRKHPTDLPSAMNEWVQRHAVAADRLERTVQTAKAFQEKVGRFYNLADEVQVIASFLKKTRGQGMSTEEAYLNMWMYPRPRELGKFAKAAKPYIPFVGFAEQAAKIYARAMRDKAIKLGLLLAAPALMTAMTRLIYGIDDDEMELLNAELGRTGNWVDRYFRPLVPTPWGPQVLDLRWIFPLTSEFRVHTGSGGVMLPLLLGNPVVDAAVAMAMNRDTFTGRPIWNEDDGVWKKRLAWAKYAAASVVPAPSIAVRSGGSGFQRIYAAAVGESNESVERAVLREVFGISVKSPWVSRGTMLELVKKRLGEKEFEKARNLMILWNEVYGPADVAWRRKKGEERREKRERAMR